MQRYSEYKFIEQWQTVFLVREQLSYWSYLSGRVYVRAIKQTTHASIITKSFHVWENLLLYSSYLPLGVSQRTCVFTSSTSSSTKQYFLTCLPRLSNDSVMQRYSKYKFIEQWQTVFLVREQLSYWSCLSWRVYVRAIKQTTHTSIITKSFHEWENFREYVLIKEVKTTDKKEDAG